MMKKDINLLISIQLLSSTNFILLLLLPCISAQRNNNKQYNEDGNWSLLIYRAIILTGVIMIFGVMIVWVPRLFGLLARIVLNQQRGSRNDSNSLGEGLLAGDAGGLDSTVTQMFPEFVYSDIKNIKEISTPREVTDCAICISEYEDEDMLRSLPKCQHVFHRECIDLWFVDKATCPCCRCNLNQVALETTTNGDVGGGAHSVIGIVESVENHPDSTAIHADSPELV